MKRYFKVLALVMVAMLAFSGFAFADDDAGTIYRQHYGSDLTELPITEETVTIDLWRSFSSTVMDSYDECEVFKKM